MKNAKVAIDFSSSKYTDAELSIKANQILDKMTNNKAFPEPDPTLDIVRTTNASYYQSLDQVKDGSREDTVIKNNLRKELEDQLRQLGDYVQRVSEGDQAVILSSGFDVHKKHEQIGPLQKPTNLIVKPGSNKGSMELACNVVAHAAFYVFEHRELPSENGNGWIQTTSTKRKVLLSGLTSGKQYAFRVAAAGADPARNWSDEINSYVL